MVDISLSTDVHKPLITKPVGIDLSSCALLSASATSTPLSAFAMPRGEVVSEGYEFVSSLDPTGAHPQGLTAILFSDICT